MPPISRAISANLKREGNVVVSGSPHERSDTRDGVSSRDPGYRCAHPGYACSAHPATLAEMSAVAPYSEGRSEAHAAIRRGFAIHVWARRIRTVVHLPVL